MDKALIRKHREQLVVVCVVLASLFLAKKAYDFQLGRASRVKENIRKEEQKALTLDRIILLSEGVEDLKKVGWSSTDFASVVEILTGLGEETGVSVLDVAPQQREDGTYMFTIPFYVTANGTYRQVAKFLAAVRALPQIVRLYEVTLAPEPSLDAAGYEVVLRVDFRGEVYYFK